MTRVTCRLTAKNRISSGTLRSVIEYRLSLVSYHVLYYTRVRVAHGTGIRNLA